MSVGLIIWLFILLVLNVSLYRFWLEIKDASGCGGMGDGIMLIVFAVILFIADLTTFISVLF